MQANKSSVFPILDDAEIQKRQREHLIKYRREFRRDRDRAGLFILSFPKAGRTWHRVMLGCYLAKLCGKPPQMAFDLDKLCAEVEAKCVVYSHNGANFTDWLPPSNPVVASPDLWRDRPVLLLVRNPKDILVSSYYHARYRDSTFPGSLSDFVRDSRTGIVKLLTALRRWHENRHLAAAFRVTSYESMHRAPESVLRTTLALAGVVKHDDALIREAIDFCTFDRMKEYEEHDYFSSPRLAVKTDDPRGRKVRAGRIGSYNNYLSPTDEHFVDEWIQNLGDPFTEYYGENIRETDPPC